MTMYRRFGWVVALLGCLALTGAAMAQESPLASEMDKFVKSYQDAGLFQGAVLVSQAGKVVLRKGYGMANREWEIPNAPDTRFRLGSVTKQFTAVLIMQLVGEGKLQLDASVASILPYYRKDTGEKITVRHLLNHTAGLPNYTAQPDFRRDVARNPYTVKDFVAKCCSGNLEFEPGARFRYSNSGYFVLGAIIEQVTGKSYETVLQERILTPLELKATGYDHSDSIIPHRATGYDRVGNLFNNTDYIDMSIPYAAGSLYSTVDDLFKWDQALYTDAVLSPELKKQMFTPALSNYGFGWTIQTLPLGPDKANRTEISHGGSINGFATVIRRVVEDRNCVILLNNTNKSPLRDISDGLLDLLYGRQPPPPKRSIAEALQPVLKTAGIDAAIAKYHELKKQQPTAYEYGEGELNALGYYLLGQGQTKEAVAFMKLNVELFPESANAYDSLGEACLVAGDKEAAIRNYARSLQLNPGNTGAVAQLQKAIAKE